MCLGLLYLAAEPLGLGRAVKPSIYFFDLSHLFLGQGMTDTSYKWVPYRAKPPEVPVDLWVKAVPLLVGLQWLIAGLLRLRLGRLGLWLWYLGPFILILLAFLLLFGALRSSRSWRYGVNYWHIAGYLGLVVFVASLRTYGSYPSSHDTSPSSVEFRLPLDGQVTVAWGGASSDVNYHVFLPDQRWAYDLLVTQSGRSAAKERNRLDAHYAWNLPVRAPAAGIVRRSVDGQPEAILGAPRWGLSGLGNHVVIEVAGEQFLFIGHLRRATVAVAVGERVHAGQVLGRVGNSGNSSEPHVHLHLQDSLRPYFGEAIPFRFSGYEQEGRFVTLGMPEGGTVDGRYVGQKVTHRGADSDQS